MVLAGWLLTVHPVPLYDGVGFPDEPYRYVKPPSPSMVTAKPPGADAVRVDVAGDTNAEDLSLETGESGPQAMVQVPQGSTIESGAGPIEAKLTPRAPSDQPPGAFINGNVYDLTVTANGAPVRFSASALTPLPG